jgi:hypothetical protein
MEQNNESQKPYVEPTLVKCEKLVEITEGAVPRISGVAPPPTTTTTTSTTTTTTTTTLPSEIR